VVKKRDNASGIHRLVEDQGVLEDPKQIEDHILSYYPNLDAETDINSDFSDSRYEIISSCIPKYD